MAISDILSEAIIDIERYQKGGAYKDFAPALTNLKTVMGAMRFYFDMPPDLLDNDLNRILEALNGLDVSAIVQAVEAYKDKATRR